MIEVDINNGRYRHVDLSKPCYCAKCGNEIKGNPSSVYTTINTHECGAVFCKSCRKKLNEYAGEKIKLYERKLVEEFLDQ